MHYTGTLKTRGVRQVEEFKRRDREAQALEADD